MTSAVIPPGFPSRRTVLTGGLAAAVSLPVFGVAQAAQLRTPHRNTAKGSNHMGTITTKDGTTIFYKDWGTGQPIVFHHGWPLSADDWDGQMMFFLQHG